jgi:hypothetical protein
MRHTFYEMDDESIRVSVAMQLAELSRNAKNIYLMKLLLSGINNCWFQSHI